MLKKLLKYDLKSIFKFVSVFYLLALFFSILTRLFLNVEGAFIWNTIGKICGGTLITMIANILINNLMRVWVRFRSNLYGDESYLTHTLPVDKKTLYLSKVIASILTVFVSCLVIVLTLFIAYYSKDNIVNVKNLLLPIANTYNSSIISLLLVVLLLVFLEIISILQVGYTGIILGHKKNYNKILNSVIYGFLSYGALQMLVFISIFGYALFNKDVMMLFTSNVVREVSSFKLLLYAGIIAYSVFYVVNYFVNVKSFAKGVDVD